MSEVLEQTAASWPEVVVSDVSELIRGVTYSKEQATDKPQDGYTPVLRATNIQESRLVLESDLVFVPDSNVSANQRLRAGDIVVATSSGSKHLVGKSGLVHSDWRGSFGAFCAAIRPKANIESRYLAAFLQSPSYWKQVGKKALGVNINNLRRGDIESLTLPLPTLTKQREIVAELEKQFSRLDEAVANLQRVKVNLKRYKASVLKAAVEGRLVETEATLAHREGRTYETGEQLLQRILEERRAKWAGKGQYKEPEATNVSDLGKLPEGWTWASAVQACEQVVDCHNKTAPYTSTGIPLVRTTNIKDGRLLLDDTRYVDQPTYEFWSRRCPPEPGDVLFTREAPMGEAGIIPPGVKLCLGQRTMLMRPSPAISSSFLLSALLSPVVKDLIDRVAVGSGVKHLRVGDVERLPVPLPPVGEQARIVAEVDRHLSILREVEAEVDANLQRAQALRQATLSTAFSR
ncbi:restriction endonuclease subunit S [Acidovorax carolinensis]|uniref:restriction endonuclease subunit S n=1 Tax=Acidovorax carolinensis TaxID=553814 RepID=UPI000B344266|nr:restriction endonuclease subunit S [Acidovorax carolinensis]ART48550.1 hypothetical protein CBP33_10755 [Acidovorax carolinensis]